MGQTNSCNLSCKKKIEDLNKDSYDTNTSTRQSKSLQEQADEVMNKIMQNSKRTINPFMSHRSMSPFTEHKEQHVNPQTLLEQKIMAKQSELFLDEQKTPPKEMNGSRRQLQSLFEPKEILSPEKEVYGHRYNYDAPFESKKPASGSSNEFLPTWTSSQKQIPQNYSASELMVSDRFNNPSDPKQMRTSNTPIYHPLKLDYHFFSEADEETVINRNQDDWMNKAIIPNNGKSLKTSST